MEERGAQQTARLLIDTGKCRVETHPQHGVVITGLLVAKVVDGRTVMVPSR
ncbi:hypothetical protein Drose_33385 [Dactylosporangium roseum]|uniref:Uncharacterized protein n=1 Tax=Dactylosporangium roseum TaxID=47989 RepID=A0ABY5Z293_9ACTN|nr:hypothetical protein [Dactylosporangium roseum]UWZ35927.1 hypothetical protein Drose_33385 [Dactylosporangium roseum]